MLHFYSMHVRLGSIESEMCERTKPKIRPVLMVCLY